ncbi:major facilitator superfamily transporter [Ceratobasidium sp. AG-Ba]|nr:major facilitator superfamily transporter [Ceratobasidium sp. AG-Ba]QRW04957.1 major facilitator superfamily transporter [Ceratobasidium sp. AG-Ba]
MQELRQDSTTESLSYDDKKATDSLNLAAGADAVQYDKGVDEAVDLVAGADNRELDPQEARRLRNKIDLVILPLLFALYILQFVDKGTLGASGVLGIIADNHLSNDEFNTLGSAFYIGKFCYIVFAYPHSWALQRFPVAKYLAANLFLWAVLMGLHPLCKNFGGLFALRFLLGASEGCITNGVMLITSMFYTRREVGERIGWTFQCNGVGTIISGFLSFAVSHADPQKKPNRWQMLMIIYAGITLIIATWFLAIFPDSPITARFLTKEEKINAVKRIQENQSGIETKTWKRSQLIEAFTDVKTWLFFLFAAVSNLQNGYGTQYQLIIKSFGFTTLQTTLLNIPSGATMIISITTSTILLRRYPNARAWIAIGFLFPSILGAILLMTIPWGNRVGLLCAYYVLNLGGAPAFVMCLGWVTVTTAGHTKKLAVNAIFLVGYSLGQILCTQFWRAQYKPRNYVPWGINLASYVGDIILILSIRYVLQKENKRRDALQASGNAAYEEHEGYVERTDSDGRVVRQKVDRGLLDMTDRENLSFRYVL